MKKKQLLESIIFILSVVLLFAQQDLIASTEELRSLYTNKQFFDLRDKLREFQSDRSTELIFYRGAVANKFNSSKESIKLLNHFLKHALPKDKNLKECYSLLADNYAKTFQYGKAAETYQALLQKFSAETDEKDKADYENVFRLWSALKNISPQTIRFSRDSRVQGIKEEVGLTVPVEINGNEKEYFIFDTGANISTITETFAKKLKLQIIGAQIDVGSITGEKVKARLGVAKKLTLGNVEAKNVVFLIFPDSALYIEPLPFQINGFIGFPLIDALREITWTKSNEIIIPARPRNKAEQNLALNGLLPLIAGKYMGKRMTFAFDTGANTSILYPPFFKAFESEIIKTGTPSSEKISGVGGEKVVRSFALKDLRIIFDGRAATFKKIEVHTEKTTGASEHFYGNIGRDLVEQYAQMTMNFRTMNISFE